MREEEGHENTRRTASSSFLNATISLAILLFDDGVLDLLLLKKNGVSDSSITSYK